MIRPEIILLHHSHHFVLRFLTDPIFLRLAVDHITGGSFRYAS
ncbi:Uncharacterised protein [Vibrio cholerae]|nr:Uncharacterised protein [Vibrio cholerae]